MFMVMLRSLRSNVSYREDDGVEGVSRRVVVVVGVGVFF